MTISYKQDVEWFNYHRTIGDIRDAQAQLYQIVGEVAEFVAEPDQSAGLAAFAQQARDVFDHLRHLLAQTPGERGGDAGMHGAKWSFAPLAGNPQRALDCVALKTLAIASPDELARPDEDAGRIVFAGGGSTFEELTGWSEPLGLSLTTSGSFLRASIAGSIATASHGSRLGFGGIQNMVRALYLVTAPGRHIWLERASSPVLSSDGLAALSAAGAEVIRVSDDRHFENALVHLGAMGVVVGVALELVENRQYAALRLAASVDDAWLCAIKRGEFASLARRHGVDHEPQFYELTIDPVAPLQPAALHIWYFHSIRTRSAAGVKALAPTSLCLAELAAKNLASVSAPLAKALVDRWPDESSPKALSDWRMVDPQALARALYKAMRNHHSAFSYYRAEAKFADTIGDFDPGSPSTASGSWHELHPGEITTGKPGALYNASFAIPREHTSAAVAAICAAVADLPRIFLFTLRFVSQPAGTLAFTRFQENTVIEIDGLSPLAIDWATAQFASSPCNADLAPIISTVRHVTQIGAARVRKALSGAHIAYSMHWGKLGDLDGTKVMADFGGNGDGAASLIEQWQETRSMLVPEDCRRLFENEALCHHRLV